MHSPLSTAILTGDRKAIKRWVSFVPPLAVDYAYSQFVGRCTFFQLVQVEDPYFSFIDHSTPFLLSPIRIFGIGARLRRGSFHCFLPGSHPAIEADRSKIPAFDSNQEKPEPRFWLLKFRSPVSRRFCPILEKSLH
jgi:hypothetical protein